MIRSKVVGTFFGQLNAVLDIQAQYRDVELV